MSEATHDNLHNADGQDQMEQLDGVTIISQSVLEEIDNSNAEESEDDSIKKSTKFQFGLRCDVDGSLN